MKTFLFAWKNFRTFRSLKRQYRRIIFYAEDAASFLYFQTIIKELTETLRQPICYLTSDVKDPMLSIQNPFIRSFYIGTGMVRTWTFMTLNVELCVMTMPDLETFHVKRSRLHPVSYIYIFHGMGSSHAIYRKGALNHYDSIFCVGPHHFREIRSTEALYHLPRKNLTSYGYGPLDILLDRPKHAVQKKAEKPHDFIAPTWGKSGIVETICLQLIKTLLHAGFFVTLRPHPRACRDVPRRIDELLQAFGQHSQFAMELNLRNHDSFYASDIMISDWSGVALEYAFVRERPVLFVDTPQKINNPEYNLIPHTPIEITIRTKIGCVVSPYHLEVIPKKIYSLFKNTTHWRKKIRAVREKTVYHVGESGVIGAHALICMLKKK